MEHTNDCMIDTSEEIKMLKRRIFNLENQLELQKQMTNQLRGGDLLQTEAIDLYPGEQLDFLLTLLKQVQQKCEIGSRAYDIIDSILSVNQPVGKSEEILDRLQKVFKKGYPSTEADIAELREIGFSFTPSRKHPKLRFHEKYMFVLPSTPGDKSRGAKNCLSDISKCVATCIRL